MASVLQSGLERWFTPETRARRPDIMDRVTTTVLADFDVHDRLREIESPTLVLVGERDAGTPPASAEALAKQIRGARTVILQV